MIIVTGANGKLGRQIVDRLLTRVPAPQVGVSVRDPRKARDLADRGVRVRQASFADPAGLAHAFEGATQVLVVSVDQVGEQAREQHRAAIEGAVAAGARRILYTSHMGSAHDSHFEACRDHAADEDPAGLRRAVHFAAQRVLRRQRGAVPGRAAESGQIMLPADGPVSWTAHADLAEAAAAILADEGRFEAPHRLSPRHRLSPSTTSPPSPPRSPAEPSRGSPPPTRSSGTDDRVGIPADRVGFLLGIFTAAQAREFATVDPTLATLIGHEPTPLSTALAGLLPAA